jgi:glycosyltransferase involved in cell wall biosynthesis
MNISIVVPVHNDAREMGICLGRILSQDFSMSAAVEVVIVDDASTEDVAQVYESCRAKGGGISWKYLRLPKNMGRFVARHEGALAASHDSLLLLDVRTLLPAGFMKALFDAGYQPLIPYVKPSDGGGWVGRVMGLVRERVYSRTHSELERRGEVTLDALTYESHAKGSIFYISRALFLRACAECGSQDKYSDDESWLTKNIIRERPLKIFASVWLQYDQRKGLAEECIHIFMRGPRFVQHYMNPKTRFFPHLMLLAAFTAACIPVAVFSPGLLLFPAAASAAILALSCLIISKRPSDVPKAVVVLPAVAGSYVAGIWWGLAVNLLRGTLRRL